MKRHWAKIIILTISVFACTPKELFPEPEKRQVVDGIRIVWDFNTLNRIAPHPGRQPGYFGYSRMIELHDGRLACVYETHPLGNIEFTVSTDKGRSWSSPQTLFTRYNDIGMYVPEIIELHDHSILVACNPRPREPYTEDRKFGIRVRKSTDGGISWGENQLIYEAQHLFKDGCWEPSFLQIPDGEVQIYFSNEGIYTQSDEQNISIFRSFDMGETWTDDPEIVGFRPNRRDGMPVPLLLKDKENILVVIEDNKEGEFKPSIYREPLADNWSKGYVGADNPRRAYHPLSDPLPSAIYGGGPYLARLKSGEVLLSYQTTWNRNLIWDRSSMAVEIADDEGKLFSRRSVPFQVPLEKWGLWNSLSVIEGNTPVAITSTNAWSDHSTEVWMIKGHVIPEVAIPNGTPVIDGQFGDSCWSEDWPYFVGHRGPVNLNAKVCADEDNLYIAVVINDVDIIAGGTAETKEGFVLQIDAERIGYVVPHHGIFALHVYADGSIQVKEGKNGKWKAVSDTSSIQYITLQTRSGYQSELAIPYGFLGINNPQKKDMGINFILKTRTGHSYYEESITSNHPDQPFSWSRLYYNNH